MSVDLQCSCGKWLRLTKEAEGSLGRCPACGTILELPTAEQNAPPPTTHLNRVDPATALTEELSLERTDRTDATASPQRLSWEETGDGEAVSESPTPSYRLASPGQIGVVGFLGGPLAGFLLMGGNYAKCGRWAACWVIIAIGLLLTLIAVGIGVALPETQRGVNLCLAVPLWIVTYLTAKFLQTSLFEAHDARGGQSASIKAMIGYTVLGAVLTFGGAFALGALYELGFGDKQLQVTARESVYYSSEVSEADARTLAFILQQRGFFDGVREKDARLHKDNTGYVLIFNLASGFDDPQVIQFFRDVAREVSHAFGGQPVRVELNDEWDNTRKTLPAERKF